MPVTASLGDPATFPAARVLQRLPSPSARRTCVEARPYDLHPLPLATDGRLLLLSYWEPFSASIAASGLDIPATHPLSVQVATHEIPPAPGP